MQPVQGALPPVGSRIFLFSNLTQKTLRIKGNGQVDANGGRGSFAKFVVSPANGFLRLQSVHDQSKFLALRQGRVDKGAGGPACHLTINGVNSMNVTISHARGHGTLFTDMGGNVGVANQAPASINGSSFRWEITN